MFADGKVRHCASCFATQTDLFEQWSKYMIATALIPNNENSTDDFAGALANQTNLAIKGIVGIEAMSRVWSALEQSATASNYSVSAIFCVATVSTAPGCR